MTTKLRSRLFRICLETPRVSEELLAIIAYGDPIVQRALEEMKSTDPRLKVNLEGHPEKHRCKTGRSYCGCCADLHATELEDYRSCCTRGFLVDVIRSMETDTLPDHPELSLIRIQHPTLGINVDGVLPAILATQAEVKEYLDVLQDRKCEQEVFEPVFRPVETVSRCDAPIEQETSHQTLSASHEDVMASVDRY